MQHYNFRPWELGRLTLAEVALFSEQAAKMPIQGGRGQRVTDEELAEQQAMWAELTPTQKLQYIKKVV